MEIKFCHRCGAPLTNISGTAFTCQNGHKLFYDATPAAACALVTHDGKIALTVRAVAPQKGKNGLFGGFADVGENFEQALARELQEEAGLAPTDYETPQYVGSATDDYEWQGAITKVLSATYVVRLKPHAVLVPADDVADVVYVTPSTIPYENIAFTSNLLAIKAAVALLQSK